MSSGEVKKVSPQDLQLVQNLIERCLQLYMSQKEVVSTLLHQAKIEPSFTELVWQKLEEENQDFFKAYHLRLIVKDQIMKFNKLLQAQADLMHQMSTSVPVSNGSHVPLLHQNPSCYSQDNNNNNTQTQQGMKVENMNMNMNMQQSTVGQLSVLMTQNSNMGIMQGMKSESGYTDVDTDASSFLYNPANNVVERHPIPSFISEESNQKHVIVNESMDASLFGFLGQIPRSFSLSDLTADFSISSDILDNYTKSPYLASDTDFLNPHGNGGIQQGRRLAQENRAFGR
ncbi:unnamed protein product [Lactuca saligna]|uniref:Angiotensin-converting enzyme 2 n=1 Tax=Lactuca saligna TaxID=75948 RepID=A0AA35Z841_LACSI|nr:unnamed protein product [Lactuca saligna]